MLGGRKHIGRDKRAGIEGLPLQLMIIVMVAGISMAIILGWTSGLSAPKSISTLVSDPLEIVAEDDNGDGTYTASGVDMTISVLDNEGNGVEGATVILEGGGIETSQGAVPHATTDGSGVAHFDSLEVSKYGNSVAFVTVTVVKSNYVSAATLSIPVIPE